MNLHEYQRSRSFIDLGPRSHRFTSANFFIIETAKPTDSKFNVEAPWDRGTKVSSNGPGRMTNMAIIPIYGKTLKKLLLWNQKADDLESWYVASGAGVLPSLFKWWLWVDTDVFYGMVKFGPLCFCMGKKVKQLIFQKLF